MNKTLWQFVITAILISFCGNAQSVPKLNGMDRGHIVIKTVYCLAQGEYMHYNNDPPNDNLHDMDRFFKSLQSNPNLLELEPELRRRYLLQDDNIQWLVEKAALCSDENSKWAISQLNMILKAESVEEMRTGNVFGPMAPEQLLSVGNLHLFDQANEIPWKIPLNALTRNMLVTGSQGGGKTRFLIWLCSQFNQMGIPFFVLDPKLGLKEWAGFINAKYIDVEDISIDLSPPPGLTYEQFLPALAPQIGDILGLIYGTEILQEAVQICIDLRNQCIQQGKNTEISLYDIYQAVPSIKDASKGRRLGYREAVTTSLGRILTGSGDLFKCRKGIDLSTLFNHNVILGCRSITDDFAAKFLALFLLYWLHESERYSPPSDQLKRELIFDDATRFLANRIGFDAASTTTPFVNIFSQLRSSGNGVITTTQVPHLADTGVLALSHTVINVGPIHFGKDKKVLGEMMGLDEDQRQALGKLEKRQAVGFCAGSAFPGVVFGKTCDVSDSKRGAANG